MKYPKISVVTITYNSEKTVEETIKSIISQDYPNLEYIIIDGVSKDHTLEIVNKYKEQISVISSEPDNGISDAFNKGVRLATGEIIGIINSDDLLLPGALSKIADNYNPSIDVYSGNVLLWDDKSGNTVVSVPELNFDKLRLQFAVAHPGRFIRKDAYMRYGDFDTRLRYNMDVDLLCRFYKKGASFYHIDSALAKFRMGGTTANSIYKKKEDYRIFIENFGGTQRDFRRIWMKAVIKYNFIQFSYLIFGKDFRYKLQSVWFYRTFFLPVIRFLFK